MPDTVLLCKSNYLTWLATSIYDVLPHWWFICVCSHLGEFMSAKPAITRVIMKAIKTVAVRKVQGEIKVKWLSGESVMDF